MEKEVINELLKERIKENENLFNKNELQVIYSNINIIENIYLLGILDSNFNAIFNAIFNATPKKSYKKRSKTK